MSSSSVSELIEGAATDFKTSDFSLNVSFKEFNFTINPSTITNLLL